MAAGTGMTYIAGNSVTATLRHWELQSQRVTDCRRGHGGRDSARRQPGQKRGPKEIRVALDPLTGVEDELAVLDQINRVAVADERVIDRTVPVLKQPGEADEYGRTGAEQK